MLKIGEDKSISVTRGDSVVFGMSQKDKEGNLRVFNVGDVIRFSVVKKKDYSSVVLQKDFAVEESCEVVDIVLTSQETRIGDTINKAVEYWYEVEVNPGTSDTIIGHDVNGAKQFWLYPEANAVERPEPNPEDIPIVDDKLDVTSKRPVENGVVTKAILLLEEESDNLSQKVDEMEERIGVLTSRVKNLSTLKEGSTTADAELIDIRVGYDGTVYESAGEAVREQMGELSKTVNGNCKTYTNALNLDDPDILNGGYYSGAEQWIANTNYMESGYIPVTGNRFHVYNCDTDVFSLTLTISWYDSEKQLVIGTFGSGNSYKVPENAAYARVPINKTYKNSIMVFFSDEEDNFTAPAEGLTYAPYGEIFYSTGQVGLVQTVDNLGKTVGNLGKTVDDLTESVAGQTKDGCWWSGKKWYAYGTSLTSEAVGKYVPFVANLSGLIVTNKGIGGGGIAHNTSVKSAVMNVTDGKTEADLITLEVGANDILAEIGTIYDTGDDTFCGALNQCIRYLQENTTAQIVVISSTNSRTNPLEYKYATDEHTQLDQRKATEDVCKLNGVYYIPMGENAGIGGARLSDNYLVDNIHHTEVGGYNLAQFMWSKLKDIPLWYTEIPAE